MATPHWGWNAEDIWHIAFGLIFAFVSISAAAEVINPEEYISKNGYHSVGIGDDGKTHIYSFTERATPPRIASFENGVAKLLKHIEVQRMCDFLRGATKARLIEQRRVPIDVAVTDYGYSGETVVCVLKYMHKSEVGTQIIYSKQGSMGMYMVFVTD